ncbi:hypothetical protein [Paractinoplanes toevensis]|nr:hypothetical protein [Actinoplanes toevensis]
MLVSAQFGDEEPLNALTGVSMWATWSSWREVRGLSVSAAWAAMAPHDHYCSTDRHLSLSKGAVRRALAAPAERTER